MPLVEKARQVSLTRNQYQGSRGRGGTVTFGHVPYGATLADLPAAIAMQPGMDLPQELIEELVDRLMKGPLRKDHVGPAVKCITDLAQDLYALTGPEQESAVSQLELAVNGLRALCAARSREELVPPSTNAGAPCPSEADRAAAITRLRDYRARLQIITDMPNPSARESSSPEKSVSGIAPVPQPTQAVKASGGPNQTRTNHASLPAREGLEPKEPVSKERPSTPPPQSSVYRARARLSAWAKRARAMLAACTSRSFIVASARKFLSGG